MGRCEEAVADYTRALDIEPGNPAALHNRGSLYERLGRWGAGCVCVGAVGLGKGRCHSLLFIGGWGPGGACSGA